MDPREMVDVAERLMEDHHAFDEAARVLRWAIELDPNEETLRLLASVLVKTGSEEEARTVLARLPETDDPEALNQRALVQAACFDIPGGIRSLDRALELDPEDYRLYANRGLLRFQDGGYETAADDLVRALVVNGSTYYSRLRYGSEADLGEFRPLFRGFKRIREEAGGDTLAFKLVDAWARIVDGKPGAARRALEGLPRGEREHWAALSLLAVCARGRNAHKIEEALLREAAAKLPGDIALLLRLHDLHRLDDSAVVGELEELLRLAPSWHGGHIRLAWARYRAGDLEGALASVEHALERDPESWGALEARSAIRQKTGDLEGALGDLDTLVTVYGADDPEPPEDDDVEDSLMRFELNDLLCDRARLRFDLRDLDGAATDYDLAVARAAPDEWLPFFARARFRLTIRERREALSDLDQVVARGGEEPKLLRLRARVREKLGDLKGAEEDRERCAAILREEAARERREKQARRRRRSSGAGKRRGKG